MSALFSIEGLENKEKQVERLNDVVKGVIIAFLADLFNCPILGNT